MDALSFSDWSLDLRILTYSMLSVVSSRARPSRRGERLGEAGEERRSAGAILEIFEDAMIFEIEERLSFYVLEDREHCMHYPPPSP